MTINYNQKNLALSYCIRYQYRFTPQIPYVFSFIMSISTFFCNHLFVDFIWHNFQAKEKKSVDSLAVAK